MMDKIKQLTSDIELFDKKLKEHCIELNEVKSSTIKDIEVKSKELHNLESKISINYSTKQSLVDESNKLRLDIDKYNKQVKYIESVKLGIDKHESHRDKLKLEIIELEKINSINSSEIELLKVDKEQQAIINEETTEHCNKIKEEIDQISKHKSSLNLDINTLTQSQLKNSQKLKILNSNIMDKESAYKILQENEEQLREKNYILNDKYIIVEGEITQLESKKTETMSEIKKMKEEIAEMNEIKDNITHQIEDERKKSRNDENRVLALKKEVLNFIISYKDIGDKRKMAEFTRRIENA